MSPTMSMDDKETAPVVTPDEKGVKDPESNDVLCGRGVSRDV